MKKKSKKIIKRAVKKTAKKKTVSVKPKKILRKTKKVPPKKKSRQKKITRKAVAKKLVPKKITPKKEPKPQEFSAQSFFKAKIKVVGIGGGGGSIVSEIGRSLHKATFVIADTDTRAFKKKPGIKNFVFGQDLTHGLGTGLDTDLAERAANQEKEVMAKLFEDQDIIIFIACLGGGLGSGATKVFAEVAKNFGGISFGIFTMPFKFEGKNKQRIATKALREIRGLLNVSITIPNERIFKIIDSNTPITQAFSLVNKSLIDSLESLIDLIYTPGVINIDFADLRAILRGTGNLAFLNTAQASGKDRADKIITDILQNPLYQYNNFTAEKVLFNIAGGTNLGMFEVDKISRAISEHAQKAKIIFGISKNPKLQNKIKTTLLMTGPGLGSEAVVEKPVIEKKPAPVKKVLVKKKKTPKKSTKKANETMVPVVSAPSMLPVEVVEPIRASLTEEAEKKAIRRSALEIKKAEELEENKKTKQEEEWEVPAFMRIKKTTK